MNSYLAGINFYPRNLNGFILSFRIFSLIRGQCNKKIIILIIIIIVATTKKAKRIKLIKIQLDFLLCILKLFEILKINFSFS